MTAEEWLVAVQSDVRRQAEDEEERDPVLVLAEDDTCGEWDGQ